MNAVDGIYGLRASDGKQLWCFPGTSVGEFAEGSLLPANGVLYVPSSNAGLFALQMQDGKPLWHFNPGGDAEISSLDRDANSGVIYATIIPSGPQYLAVLQTNGQLIKTIRLQSGSQQISHGVLYQVKEGERVLDSRTNTNYETQFDLTAIQLSDEKVLWSTHLHY